MSCNEITISQINLLMEITDRLIRKLVSDCAVYWSSKIITSHTVHDDTNKAAFDNKMASTREVMR